MNKTTKRGLEGVLSAQISEARKTYLLRRKDELAALADEVRKSPSKKALALLSQYNALADTHERERREHKEKEQQLFKNQNEQTAALVAELTKMGYDWHTDYDTKRKKIDVLSSSSYDGEVLLYKYTEPRLKPHCDETDARLKGLNELFNSTVIDLYVGDPAIAVANFRKKVKELTA